MAALGCSTATTQMGQLCAAKYNVRVAGFQAITHSQAVNDRSQSCSVVVMGSRAAMTGEGRHRAHPYNSAWGRGNNTIISGQWPSSGSQSGGWLGSFLQIFRPSTNAFNSSFGNNFGEDVRVDNRSREPARPEPEWLEAEAVEPSLPKAEDHQTLNVVEVKKQAAQNANVAKTAVNEGSTVAKSALDVLRTTGLEIDLDVGLKELTIKELVLKDLGLVLAVKTKPPQQQQAQAESPQVKEDKGGNNNTA